MTHHTHRGTREGSKKKAQESLLQNRRARKTREVERDGR
jgi:hypothetical protein